MTFKTILMHMGEDDDCERRVRIAVALARRFGAAIDLLYVVPTPTSPIAGRGASMAYVREKVDSDREQGAEVVRHLRHHWEGLDVHFHAVTGEPAEVLAHRSTVADLVVVSQHECHGFSAWFDTQEADTLPGLAACPVLVIPNTTEVTEIGRAVLATFAPTREFARALREGLPLLRAAERAMVFCTDLAGDRLVHLDDVKHYLARHQVSAAMVDDHHPHAHIGEAILEKAKTFAADCIVLGADLNARWQDTLFGGNVRHVLNHTRVPVLLTR